MINILKASAGSGKTFRLAKTYISILLASSDRYAYRHVLAVTFTNKATAEMKSRILKELHILARTPEKSDYIKDFLKDIHPDVEEIRRRAERILVDILHDYGAFSVSTIDKFFQMTLRAFSREIGQFASYQVELDKNSLVHESVDRILDSLTEDQTDLIGWLNEGVMEQLRQGSRVNLEKGLYEVAERLKSEEQRELSEQYGLDPKEIFSQANLSSVRAECEAAIADFEKRVRDAASAVMDVMSRAGVPLEETNRKFLSKIADYAEAEPGSHVARPSDSFLGYASDSRRWFAKARQAKYLPLLEGVLDEPLDAFCALFDTPFKVYSTALLLKEQTFKLGLAGDFFREFDALLKEKNVLGIDDSNSILRDIIDGSDAPFVYEKLGVRFENFLLDEFQDTSSIQWDNFLPLLRESEANNHQNLVVGDVKQSIYRWRGSDWKLLAQGIRTQFDRAVDENLEDNWRSCRNIVEFNNSFFKQAAESIGVSEIYSDLRQNVKSKDSQDGYVRVTFCPKDSECGTVLSHIAGVKASGAEYGDIAILVRTNAEGGAMASFLMEHGIPVISDDSLNLKSSAVVRRLVSLLSCVENPDDTVASYLARSLDIEFPDQYHSLVDLCESLLRSLMAKDPAMFEGETLYVQSFMDFLQDWCSGGDNNLMHFLKHWAESPSPCLSSPADQDSVRIMTIHKSKGLEFPCVIFPYAESVGFYKAGCHWCRPDTAGQDLPKSKEAIYPVDLTSKTENTLFSKDYSQEKDLQKVDNINTMYVALTRAESSLYVVACTPPASYYKDRTPKDFSQVLYSFATSPDDDSRLKLERLESVEDGFEVFEAGEPYDYSRMCRKAPSTETTFLAGYPSYPLGSRLRLSTDAADFFSPEGNVGTRASHRLNGIVLHDILASVKHPSDLRQAVDAAVMDGRLSAAEGEEDYAVLQERIASVAGRGWFPDESSTSVVSNEITIIDEDGREYRPDRVITGPDSIVIVDYKFGEQKPAYLDQVRKYSQLYAKIGQKPVSGYVWYVFDNLIKGV